MVVNHEREQFNAFMFIQIYDKQRSSQVHLAQLFEVITLVIRKQNYYICCSICMVKRTHFFRSTNSMHAKRAHRTS